MTPSSVLPYIIISMIFEQNQEKIIEQTLNAFAAIARGNFVCAVIAHLERKKHLQSRPSRET